MSKLRVAVVGAGYFSQFQFLGWRNIGDVEVLALGDLSKDRGEALAARYGPGWRKPAMRLPATRCQAAAQTGCAALYQPA